MRTLIGTRSSFILKRRVRRILPGGLLCLALSAGAVMVNPDAERYFAVLSGTFQSGQYESTVAGCDTFLKQYPRDPKAAAAKYLKAEAYFRQNRFNEAAGEFKEFIGSYGSAQENLAVSARLRLGECHYNLKKYLTALDYFAWVEKSKNASLRAESLLGSAHCLLVRGEHGKAEIYLLKLLQANAGYANLPQVVVPLALVRMERGEYQDALALLERAPDDPACQYYRGVCQRLSHRVIAAAQILKDLVDNDTAKIWTDKALFQMGEAYFQSKEYPLAYSAFKRIHEKELQSPLRPYALFRMGCVNFQNGAFEAAGQNWSQLMKEFPENISGPSSQYLMAEIALRQNELGKAITGFGGLAALDDYAMDAQYKIIWCLAAQGQYDQAISRSQKFLKDFEWGELYAKVSLLMGLCQQMMKQTDEAMTTYQSILDRYPNTAYYEKALYLLAVALVQDKRYAEVVTHVYTILKTAPASPSRWQAETYYWVAESYFNIGQFELARQTYDLLIKNFRQTDLLPGATLGVAASLARLGLYDQAVETQARALELSQQMDNPEVKKTALLDSADVFFNKHEYEKAASFYEEFFTKYPDDSRADRALHQSGLALYRLEYFTDAIKKWTTLTERYPSSRLAPDAMFQSARTQFGLGQYPQAYGYFRQIVEKYPESPLAKESMLMMGQCHYNAGDMPRAIEQYKAYMEKYPLDEKMGEVQDLLQMAYYKQGKTGDDMKGVADQFPQSKFTADIYWELGAEAYNRKNYDRALDYFERLILDFPNSSQALQAYYYKADSYFLKGDFPNAVMNFKNFVLNYPQDALTKDSRFKLAVAYFSLKNYGEAAVAFHDFIEKHPDDPKARDASLNIPVCYGKAGQPYQGVSAYEDFLRRYPGDSKAPFAILQTGQLYEQAEDFAKAAEAYKKVPADQPEVFEAYFSMGRCYKKLKASAEEKAAYRLLQALTPRDNKFRLAGLVMLGEALESDGAKADAVAVYQDIASHSTNAEWRAIAQEKISALKGGK